MSENESKFDFAGAYRKLQVSADRKDVIAREAAHKKVRKDLPNSASRIVDLALLAFDIPRGDRSLTWLEAIVKEKDPHFSLEIDAHEARIIATLLLADMVSSGLPGTPALVMSGCLAGRRRMVDDDQVVLAARNSLASMGRTRGLAFSTKLSAPRWSDVSKAIAEAQPTNPATITEALKVIAEEAKAAEVRLVEKFNRALGDLTKENRRLAEEVDLLWWRMGRWSYLLDRPLSDIAEPALPFVVGTDVAAMINVLPGPHGALGVIRDALGPDADAKQTIKATIEAIPAPDRERLLTDVTANLVSVTPLNAALRLYDDDSIAASVPVVFEKRNGVSIETGLTRFEIAAQAFYERVLIKSGWF